MPTDRDNPTGKAREKASQLRESPASAPSIRWWGQTWVRLTVCFIFVATVPLTITAVYTTRRHLAVVRSVAADAAAERAASAGRALEDALDAARNDTLALAEWPILESYFRNRGGDDSAFWEQKLEVQLRTFMELNAAYRRIILADGAGRPLMNILRQGTTTSIMDDTPTSVRRADSTRPRAVPDWPREWYERAAALLPRQADLHVLADDESGPLAVSAAVVPRTARRGGAIVLVEADLAAAVESVTGGSQRRIVLFDGAGRVTYDSAGSPAAFDPPPPSGQFIDTSNRLISTAPLATGAGAGTGRWTLAVLEPAGVLESGVAAYRGAFLNVLLGALLIAVLLGMWISRQFTRPVRRLYEATRRIGGGDFDVALADETGDEVGALTTQVQIMAAQLRESHESFERRLHDKTEELIQAERLATIGRTAAAVAHEINNPSGIIALHAQMLIERLPPDDPKAAKLRTISESSQEISRVVRELLDYARKPEPVQAWVETRPLLQSAMNAALCMTDGGGDAPRIQPRLEVDDRVPRLFVDPHQVARLVRNLVANAVHAMPDGGTLTVRCAADGDGSAVIDVADTGTGISEEQKRHLFDAFYSTKRFGAGTGLGLAISKEIVERHGGSIAVDSTPGHGTTVTVRIPFGEEEATT